MRLVCDCCNDITNIEADRMEIQGDKLMVYSRGRLVGEADAGEGGKTMTGKEIVQALRCCAKGLGHDDACENCKVGEIQDRREYIEFAAANVIERLTAENAALREKVPQWISVEERRPEPGKRVLATDGVFVGEAYRTSADTWRRYDGIAMRDCLGSIVTHWMPLPEAAAEEGDKT